MGADFAVGAGAGTRPALSVQLRTGAGDSVHVTSHLSDERVVITGDLQRRMTPAFGYGSGWRLDFYGGLGAEGASERTDHGEESYRLRLPLGAECELRSASMLIFAEAAATVGPIPATRLSGVGLAGLRALF